MPSVFSRLKNWTTEILSNTDLNAEIDNILNNLDPTGVGNYSATAAQMKLTTNPGTTGSESLATSLAGELERLRFVLKAILGTGVSNWYDTPPTTLTFISTALGNQSLANRIVSGRTTGNSSQLCALIPANTTAAVVLTASGTTPFIYAIGGTQYTISSNATVTGLSLGSGASCTGSNTSGVLSGQQYTKGLGQYGTYIMLANSGSAAAAIGNYAAFKHGTEVFLSQMVSTAGVGFTAVLTNAWRSCFFDTNGSAIAAAGISDNEVFTMLKLTWVFVNTSGSMAITYTNPTYAGSAPTSPATGDYWFDFSTTAWKTYNSTTWVAANAVLIGMCAQDTGGCVAARTFDSYVSPSDINTTKLTYNSTASIQLAGSPFSNVNVFGTKLNLGDTLISWTNPTNLESGVSVTTFNTYYAYLKETGVAVLSDKLPADRRDLLGYYHPSETWRCLGSVMSNGSSAFVTPVRTFRGTTENMFVTDVAGYGKNNASALSNNLTDVLADRVKFSSGVATWSTAQSQYADLTTLSLTPGVWAINANVCLDVSAGSTAKSLWTVGVSNLTAGNSFSDRLLGFNAVQGMIPGNATISVGGTAYTTPIAYVDTLTVPPMIVSVSDSGGTQAQSWYLKLSIANTAATTYIVDGYGILARRIDNLVGGNA